VISVIGTPTTHARPAARLAGHPPGRRLEIVPGADHLFGSNRHGRDHRTGRRPRAHLALRVERQLDTNVLGSMDTGPRRAAATCAGSGGGHLIQLSSGGRQAAFPLRQPSTNATKWAMEGFYEALGQEVAGLGIHTTLVEPGGFRTDANTRSVDAAHELPAYARARAELPRSFATPIGDRPGWPPPCSPPPTPTAHPAGYCGQRRLPGRARLPHRPPGRGGRPSATPPRAPDSH